MCCVLRELCYVSRFLVPFYVTERARSFSHIYPSTKYSNCSEQRVLTDSARQPKSPPHPNIHGIWMWARRAVRALRAHRSTER
jgi:hypothetical protein